MGVPPTDVLLNALLAQSEEAIVGYSPAGIVNLWSSAAEKLFGFRETEIIGKPITAVLPLFDVPELEGLLHDPTKISGELRRAERVDRHGDLVSVLVEHSPLYGSDGSYYGIVERARTPGSVEQSGSAHAQLRLLMEQMPLVLWATDRKLKVTSCMGSAMSGLVKEGIAPTGESIHTLLQGKGEKDSPVREHLDAPRGVSSRFEVQRGERVFDLNVEPLRDRGGTIIGCVGAAVDITERKQSEEEARYQATHDGLTGLANYREFFSTLEREILRADRSRQTFALLLLDLDNLKLINDRFGHLKGNDALKLLATVMKESCRVTDLPARYGGDEFAVLLIGADAKMAQAVAERIGRRLSEQSSDPKLTVSIGLAVYPDDGRMAHELLETADKLLYQQKRSVRMQLANAQ